MCPREPSKHYTYQAVDQMHIYGGLHKQFRQQLTPWLLLFLGALEKCPADVHPLSLHYHPSMYLADQELLHPNSLPMSCYLMGYVLSCLFNRELIQMFTPFITAVDS